MFSELKYQLSYLALMRLKILKELFEETKARLAVTVNRGVAKVVLYFMHDGTAIQPPVWTQSHFVMHFTHNTTAH